MRHLGFCVGLIRLRLIALMVALVGASAVLYAADSGISFLENGDDVVTCWFWAESDNPEEIVTADVRIYGPDNQLLNNDAVGHSWYIWGSLYANKVGPGQYRCLAFIYDGSQHMYEQFVTVQ